MNWLAIRTWAMANLRTVLFGAGIILLLGYILFGGSSPNADIPGGGFGTLVASALLFWGSYKTTGTGSKIIGAIATILLIIWAWPRFFPFLNNWGFAPNLILILAILAFIWMWKDGKGFLGWRMIIFIVLFTAWLGARGGIIKDGFKTFIAATGIEFKMPEIEIPEAVKNAATGFAKYMKNFSAQKISQSKERLVKNGSTFYNYNGASFTKKDFSSQEEFIKVFILDEQATKDGLTFEKVRVGDPATGEDAWVYSGILLTSPTASAPQADPSGKASTWQKIEEKVVDFSKLKIERFDQKLSFPVIPISLNKQLETGNYRIKLSGNWEFFMSNGIWKQFPWQGKTYANNLPEYRPDKKKEFCAVILINNGEDITPVDVNGFLLNSTGSANLSLKINLLMRADEFYSERIVDRASKLTLSNSEKEPLTITIEKEVVK